VRVIHQPIHHFYETLFPNKSAFYCVYYTAISDWMHCHMYVSCILSVTTEEQN